MVSLREIKDSFLHSLFPHVCDECVSDMLSKNSMLRLQCMEAIPQTDFEKHPGNPIEKRFYGRLPLEQATASYYFTNESLVQKLVHQVKYKGNKEPGI